MTSSRSTPRSLRLLRQLRGFSQAQLAKRTGRLSQGHISDLERGDKQPRPATLRILADTLDVPLSMLLEDLSDDIDETWRRLHADADTRTTAATP